MGRRVLYVEAMRRFNNPEWPKFLNKEALSHPSTSDLVFICQNQVVYSQQSLVASYSPFLSKLFSGYGCCACKATECTRRDTVYITVETKGATMGRVLNILHTGSADIKNKKHKEEVHQVLDMLVINLHGGLETVICKKKDNTDHPMCHYVAWYNPQVFKLTSRVESNETDPVNGQKDMAEQLSQISMDCVMQGCKEDVSLSNMTTHFRHHIIQNETDDSTKRSLFSCNSCKKKFPFRRALDDHNKKYHKTTDLSKVTTNPEPEHQPEPEPEVEPEFKPVVEPEPEGDHEPVVKRRKIDMNTRVERFSHTDITKDLDAEQQPQETPEAIQSCLQFDRLSEISDESYLSLPETEQLDISKNNNELEDEDEDREFCFTYFGGSNNHSMSMPGLPKQNQSYKEKKVNKSQHKAAKKKTKQPNPWTIEKKGDTTSCQICHKKFEKFSKLKTHYTRDHYWFKLNEQYARFDRSCYICMKKFPTTDHLLQHMGNFHACLTLDEYLKSEGRPILTIEWTVKLLNQSCPFPNCTTERKTSALLKDHLATKHFASQLKKEFPAEKSKNIKCAKCSKMFRNKRLRIGHIGAFHDEVLKYAGDMIEVDAIDRNIIPENDFDDGACGEDIEDPYQIKTETEANTTLFEGSIKEEEVFICSLENCVEECSSKQNYALHLYREHYKEIMLQDFKKTLDECPGRCPVCNKDLGEWRGQNESLEHMAVDHEYVMKYLEKDLFPITLIPEQNIKDIKKEEIQESSPLLFDNTIILLESDSEGTNTP